MKGYVQCKTNQNETGNSVAIYFAKFNILLMSSHDMSELSATNESKVIINHGDRIVKQIYMSTVDKINVLNKLCFFSFTKQL